MLRRLDVRTRLIAMIAVPLALLLAVAIPEALQRQARAADAGRAAAASDDVVVVAALIDALQGERTISAALRAGASDDLAPSLDDQRGLVDAALAPAELGLGRLSRLESVRAVVGAARTEMTELDAVRAQMDTAESQVPWLDPFAPLLGSLLDVQEAVGSATDGLGVGNQLSLVALIARAKEATAVQAAQIAAAATWGELRGEQVDFLSDRRSDEAAYRTAYLAASPTDARADRRSDLGAGDATLAGRTVDAVVGGEAVSGLRPWLELGAGRQQIFRQAESDRAGEAVAAAKAVETSSSRSSNGYLALAALGIALALGLALAAARSITRPLRELTEAAAHLAEERLPKLVDALRHPVDDDEHHLATALQPIEVRADDELGHLAHAFNAVQSVAVEVASEQAALLKKGISDLYVNLARRNQALIDRQIQLLDQLEAEEQDAEVLEHLYLLDHLATRMRRNAESLLILAGSESGPRRSKPIGLVDVVRASLSEVEEYERVDLGSMASATLHGPAVSDVAHLVAELLENATQFSPPSATVRVDGIRTGGSYQLVITDRGIGMSPGQLDELNAVLRDPPVTGLALGRSLGCLVAARLAVRHGITVRLRAGDQEGVAAYVVLPRHLLVDEATTTPDAPDATHLRSDTLVELPADDAWSADWDLLPVADPVAPAAVEPVDAPARLRDALPAGADFDAGLQSILDDDGAEPVLVEPSLGEDAASASGPTLRRRVPGATTEALAAPSEEPSVRRSPDEVRAMLSRYRSGLQAGRDGEGPDEERS